MGQKTNPIGLRLGVIKGWDSNWFGGKDFSAKLVEDDKIRKYLNARLGKAGISKIAIERSLKYVTVTIFTARPGMIIGKGGEEVDKLKKELVKLTGKEIQININEIKRPELDAYIVASTIAKQIEGRVSYVGGAEIARSESYKEGRIPLHTLRADIDYSLVEAHTSYGRLGIKVWICKGEIYGKPELVPTSVNAPAKKQGGAPRPAGRGPRRGGEGKRK